MILGAMLSGTKEIAPGRVSHDRLVLGDRPDKNVLNTLVWMEKIKGLSDPCRDMGYRGLESGLGKGLFGECLVAASLLMRPGGAQPE